MADNHGAESFLAGFLIGGVIGAGLALLFAPASGKETREFIRSKATQAIDEGKEEVDKIRQVIREELERLAEGKDNLIKSISEKFQKEPQTTQEAESAG